MAYEDIDPEQFTLRDHLALDRTKLANERTLLAYVRTAIMLLVSGVTVMRLFPDDSTMTVFACILTPTGLGAGIIGAVQYLRMRRRITRATDVSREGQPPAT